MPNSFTLRFNQIDFEDVGEAGHHGVDLSHLVKSGIPVPDGFVISVRAYNDFLKINNLEQKAKHLLSTVNLNDPNSIREVSRIIRKYVTTGEFSKEFMLELYSAYKKIGGILNDSKVLIRTSPHSKNELKHHKLIHHAKGETNLIEKIKECWSLNFDENRLLVGFNDDNSNIIKAILVQKLVEPDASGKIYTQNPNKNAKNFMLITAMYGVYESTTNLVTYPDHYEVEKATLKIDLKEVSSQIRMTKKVEDIKKTVNVSSNLRKKQKINDAQILELARLGKTIEKLYYFPYEIDWSIQKGQIYLTKLKHMTPTQHIYA